MQWRLRPYAMKAATVCDGGCERRMQAALDADAATMSERRSEQRQRRSSCCTQAQDTSALLQQVAPAI